MEGGIFTRPTAAWYSNNFLPHVGRRGTGGLNDVSKPTEEGIELWSTEIGHDSSQIIRREFRNKMDQVGIRFYDVSKGCMLVSRKQYYKKQLNLQVDVSYKRVSGGAWFPVRVMTEMFNINTGETIRLSNVTVDVNETVFNDPNLISDDVFELEIGPNAEVIDFTSLKMRLKKAIHKYGPKRNR